MITDEVKILIRGGAGGDGHVSFRREKFVPRGGPDGGNGAIGGDVYFIGTSDLTALNFFRGKKEIKGIDGGAGEKKKKAGKKGEDIFLKVPVGTIITDLERGEKKEMWQVGQKILIARGGAGGRGNFEFRSSTNQAPKYKEEGHTGQTMKIHLSLQFIADIGLIGLPNAGKSTLLNILTSANVKVADYPFTTLEANLGSMNGKIIADIPGLIEGASRGRGLGIKFLKHIKKTKLLVHCIDISGEKPEEDYQTVRGELEAFNRLLLQKKEILVLTKADLLPESKIKQKLSRLRKINPDAFAISILNDKDISKLKNVLRY